jgi:DNA-binding NtrC family response regulator
VDKYHKNLDQILESFEHNIIEATLKDTRGNQSKAARLLGITKRKIQYKIRKYGIDCRSYKEQLSAGSETCFEWRPQSNDNNPALI